MNLRDDEAILLRGYYRAAADTSVSSAQIESALQRIRVTPQRSSHWWWPRWRAGSGAVSMAIHRAPRLGLALLVLAAMATAAIVGTQLLRTIRPLPLPVLTPTGSMTTPRADLTMTLLLDGRVLIAGGWEQQALDSAELYDPRTGTFTPTGSMHAARSFATATLLRDGQVLIAGGQPHGAYHVAGWTPGIDSAELFDPTTGTFSLTGSMTLGRAGHTATLLADGRVLITGGYGPLPLEAGQTDHNGSLAAAEIFDPATGSFMAIASMARSRYLHEAVPLADGRVLIAGGLQGEDYQVGSRDSFSPGGGGTTTPEIFDPSTGTFQDLSGLSRSGQLWLAAPLGDGQVLMAGSALDDDGLDAPWAYLLDPISGATIALDPPAIEDHGQSARASVAPLADGRLLITGLRLSGVAGASADVFEPASRTFEAMPVAADFGSGSVLLPDGRTLIAGGSSFEFQTTDGATLLSVATGDGAGARR